MLLGKMQHMNGAACATHLQREVLVLLLFHVLMLLLLLLLLLLKLPLLTLTVERGRLALNEIPVQLSDRFSQIHFKQICRIVLGWVLESTVQIPQDVVVRVNAYDIEEISSCSNITY